MPYEDDWASQTFKHPEKDEKLPELGENQVFTCEMGCGVCKPVEYDFVFSRSTSFRNGTKEMHTHKAYKSSCCGGELDIYDEVD